MRPMTLFAALGSAGGVLAACSAPLAPAGETAPAPASPAAVAIPAAQPAAGGIQTILKLRDPKARVDTPEMLAQLGAIAGARIAYVRAMSGDAHVVRMTPLQGRTYDAALADLRASRLIDYAEPDATRRAQ